MDRDREVVREVGEDLVDLRDKALQLKSSQDSELDQKLKNSQPNPASTCLLGSVPVLEDPASSLILTSPSSHQTTISFLQNLWDLLLLPSVRVLLSDLVLRVVSLREDLSDLDLTVSSLDLDRDPPMDLSLSDVALMISLLTLRWEMVVDQELRDSRTDNSSVDVSS